MNTKNFLRLAALVVVLVMAFSAFAVAQTTYYVNVVTGLDGYNGLSPTVTGVPGVGPKQTIANAITAASPGDIVTIDYGNGNLYNENVTVTKKLTFGTSNNSGSGTPQVVSWTINNANASPDNTVTFTGAIKINAGLTLTQGSVIGAGNLTVGGFVSRAAQSNSASATVDAQLNYTGDVNFFYVTGGFNMTTGLELVPGTNTTNFNNLTTTGAGIVTLNEAKTMKGVLATAGPLALGGFTFSINGGNAHTVGGNVTNGTLAFTMSGASSVTGNFNLPHVTATTSGTTAYTLTLNTNTSIGNITANSVASVNAAAAGGVGQTVGAVVNSGSGTITLGGALNITSLSNSSSGVITLTAAGAVSVTGDVNQSGSGSILFNSATSNTIGGSVTNSPSLALTNATVSAASNRGVIRFVGDVPATISGSLSVTTTITGATGAAPTNWTNAGEVSFGAAASLVTITGSLTVNATHSITYGGTGAPVVSNNAGVVFSTAGGNIVISGGITNSTNWASVTSVTMAGNGDINMSARTSGTLGTAGSRVGAVNVSSSSTADGGHGNLLAGGTTGGFFGTSVTTGGAKGGQILFGNAPFNVSGNVSNTRTGSGYAHIQVGSAATAGVTVTIGGSLENSGKSNISFAGFNGAAAEAFSVTGQLISSGDGVISVGGAQTGTGTFSFGGVNITSGTVNLAGVGAGTMNVVVNGTATFAGGIWNMGTSAARNLQLGGLQNNFSSASGRTDFSSTNMANVTLVIQPTSVIAGQTIAGNSAITVWYGPLNVNNASGLQPAVTFNSGNFRVLNNVTFTAGQVKVDNVTLFIGGQLAPFAGGGNFVNTAGYTSTGNGFISMNGNAAQAVSGAGTFANFEVDATGQTVTVAASTGDFTGTFNLTAGSVAGGGVIIFNNTTAPPTIVVNAGSFAASPTFTSTVNVYYIGVDKTVGFELPTTATKLNNLTVATSNGATTGKGTVNVNVATTVNGTITVFAGQALLLNGVDLTMKGASIQLDGDITNVAAGDQLILSRTAGTTITGGGALPDILVAAGSTGNVIDGSVGLATQLLGANNVRGADDVNPGTGGSIVYAGGTASSLTAKFGTANTTSGQHLTTVTTQAGGTLTLGANMTQGGALTHNAGTIDVATFVYDLKSGVAQTIDGTAIITGTTGTFKITMTASQNLSIATQAGTISANVQVSTSPSATAYTLSLITNNLSVAGSLTLSGTATVDIANGLTLTGTGTAVTMGTGTAFTAAGGTGVLRLNSAVPPLTLSGSGAVTIANLRISNDVNLALTGTTPSMTVSTAFTHDGGNLNFGAFDLTITGTFTKSGTTSAYSATTGYLIINNGAFAQGASNFSIPNLRFTANSTFANAGVVTVTTALSLRQAGVVTQQVSSANKLTVADGATVNYRSGSFDAAPTYAGTITLVADQVVAGGVIHSSVWPSSATLVSTFRMVQALATDAVQLPGDRTVNTALDLRTGVLDLGTAADRTLTTAASVTITLRSTASVALNGGAFAFGADNSVIYQANTAMGSGAELPTTVKDLTITRFSNAANAITTINSDVTVTGVLTVRNNLTISTGISINTLGDVTISRDASFAAATDPAFAGAGSIGFTGSSDQTVTVPTAGASIGNININKTGGDNKVTITGGNLTSTGIVTFSNGLVYTGTSNSLILGGNTANSAVNGFTRTVAAPGKSHVVGNLRVPLKLGQIIAFGRNEFPVGDATFYRPSALTFINTALPAGIALGVSATVRYDGTRPTGIVGLPITDGVEAGTDVARYPDFNWAISTTGSLGATQFNLELTAEGYSGFDDVANVRIIRRNGAFSDITNQWTLQGAQYDNFVISGVPYVVNVNSVGGLIQGGAIFTYGLKSTMVVANPIATVNLTDAAGTFTRDLTNPALFTGAQGAISYTVSVSNSAIVTATITNNVLTVTKKVSGSASITVTGTDAFDGSRINHTFAVNVVSDVETGEVVPTEFTLSQNYPNPFNPSTTIKFGLPKEAPVTLEIYNVLGVKVRTLIAGETMSASFHTLVWDGKDDGGVAVPSGVYLYRVHADKFQASKKMTLIK